MFSFVKKEKESSRESCERAKRQLRGGLERAERESWDTERGTKERALRERELKRVQKRAQGRGSHIHSLLSSYVLCPPKGEAAVRLLWFSFCIKDPRDNVKRRIMQQWSFWFTDQVNGNIRASQALVNGFKSDGGGVCRVGRWVTFPWTWRMYI